MSLRRWRGLIGGILAVLVLDVLVLVCVLGTAMEGGKAELRFSQATEVANLDPAKMTALNDGRVASALFEGLVVMDAASQQATPGVARSWTLSPDGLTYTFTLRDDARWSDGSPVTADDFRYSWVRVLDIKTAAPYNYMLFAVKGAKEFADSTAAVETLKSDDPAGVAEKVGAKVRPLYVKRTAGEMVAGWAATALSVDPAVQVACSATRLSPEPVAAAAVGDALEALEIRVLSPESRRAVLAAVGEAIGMPSLDAEAFAAALAEALQDAGIQVLTLAQARERVPLALAALGIEVLSPTQLRVTLEQPTHYFLDLVGFSTLLPVKRECIETVRDGETVDDPQWVFPGRIVSNGPYMLQEWVYKSRMRLVRNPYYWNRANVRIGSIDLLPIDSSNSCLVAYECGELDFITTVPPLAAGELYDRQKAGRRPDFWPVPNWGTYYYRFNCTRKPLDDVRVRKALVLALDKREIVVKAGRLDQPVADVLVPPVLPEYKGPKGLQHDPDLARRLLAEAGFPGGKGFPKLTLLYNTEVSHKNIAELVQAMWKRELGITTISLANVEWKIFLERCNKLDYDIARAGWYGDYFDPNTFLDMFVTGGGNNNTGWSNAEYDRLIEQAAATLDVAERAAVFRRAEVILVEEELPILPLYHYVGPMLIRPHVKGWRPNLRNDVLFQNLWIERGEGGP